MTRSRKATGTARRTPSRARRFAERGNTDLIDPVLPRFVAALVLMVMVGLATAPPPPEAIDPFFADEPSPQQRYGARRPDGAASPA